MWHENGYGKHFDAGIFTRFISMIKPGRTDNALSMSSILNGHTVRSGLSQHSALVTCAPGVHGIGGPLDKP